MKITFLGTGTSQGVPVIACDCEVCRSSDRRDKRLRVSLLVNVQGKTLVIDAGPDFRYQMLRAKVGHLDAVLMTHEHKDHTAGLDDVRAFNFKQQSEIDVYALDRVQDALKLEFHYVFRESPYPGIPRIRLHEIFEEEDFLAAGVKVRPVPVMHHKLPVMGFRIGNFSYITDAKTISAQSREKLRGSEVLVINALQREPHISHLTFDEALEIAADIGAERTYFTHISHRLGLHAQVDASLPAGVFLAYDGLELELDP